MERWRQRMEFWSEVARFFRQSVILDVICPIGGVAGLVFLIASGSDSAPAWLACGGAIGLPGFGAVADWIANRPRGP